MNAADARYLITTTDYIVLPLHPGTKRPMIRWKHLQHDKPSKHVMRSWFTHFINADVAILTGHLSGVMCLDFDAPPYLDGYTYTATPSGGRHYFFAYHDGDHHGLSVRAGLDIPYIVKLYAPPQINPGRMPINAPDHPTHNYNPSTPIVSNSPPSSSFLGACEFVQWFQQRRDDPTWDGRYPLARAFASNQAMCTDPDRNLGPDYRHTSTILSNLARPITCRTIVSQGFNCPAYNPDSQTCTKQPGVTSPYGLAARLSTVHARSERSEQDNFPTGVLRTMG